jgi:hypothetical protein
MVNQSPVDSIAVRQYGLLTREQVKAVFTSHQLRRRLEQGRLFRVQPGVFRCEGSPPSRRQTLLAACLSIGPLAAASHRSAAKLWGLAGVASVKLELSVPPGRYRRLDSVAIHRTDIAPDDIVVRAAIPVTTPERTLLDLCRVASLDTIERSLDDGLRQQLFTVSGLMTYLHDRSPCGRGRLRLLLDLLDERGSDYRPGESIWEDRVYQWIVDSGQPPPVRQRWVVVGGKRRRIDLAYPDLKIAIEFDGWDEHRSFGRFHDDRARITDLTLAGWLVVTITSRTGKSAVVEQVAHARALRLPRQSN